MALSLTQAVVCLDGPELSQNQQFALVSLKARTFKPQAIAEYLQSFHAESKQPIINDMRGLYQFLCDHRIGNKETFENCPILYLPDVKLWVMPCHCAWMLAKVTDALTRDL